MLGRQSSDGLGEDLPEIMEGAVFYEKRNQTLFKGTGVLQQSWLAVSLAIFIGLAVGVYLDRRFETSPWCTLIFLVLGIIGGFRNIAIVIRRTRKY